MTSCPVYGCLNKPSMKKPGLTFHCFPKDEERRRKWLVGICRENWTPNKNSKVCSEHFPEEMIDRTSLSCVRLKENAVPSAFEDDSPLQDVNKINQRSLNEALHKNADSASLIIEELFSIEAESSEDENEIQPDEVKVKTMSTSLTIQNSVCITEKRKFDAKCKTNSTSPSTAVQNLVSASLNTCKKRKTAASVASQNLVSCTINENGELELNKTSAYTEGQNTNQSNKSNTSTVFQKSVSVAPNANKLAIQKLTKNLMSASEAVQTSSNAPDLNSISHLIEAIKSSSGNSAKIVVIEGIKDKDSVHKRTIAKFKKALKAEKKKVKILKKKIKSYQKTLSNVTDLLNDIRNQKVEERVF